MYKYDKTRFNNMRALEELKIDPYPTTFNYTCSTDHVIENMENYKGEKIIIIGRVTDKQIDNEFIQGVITRGKNKIDFKINASYKLCNYLDVGDIIQIKGKIKKDNKLYLAAHEFIFVTKSLRNYPSAEDWFKDLDKQRTQYEISLLLSNELKDIFIKRCKAISVIRKFLEDKGFIEVDTPIILPSPVMAPVKDFVTTEPEFNPKSYLRITNTDFMRRYLISGLERIFHIGKFFRDEPLTSKNYFEFTMLTFGIVYGNYNDIANIIEETIYYVIEKVFCKNKLITFRGKSINFEKPWKGITMRNAIKQYARIDIGEYYDEKSLREKLREKGITVKEKDLYSEL